MYGGLRRCKRYARVRSATAEYQCRHTVSGTLKRVGAGCDCECAGTFTKRTVTSAEVIGSVCAAANPLAYSIRSFAGARRGVSGRVVAIPAEGALGRDATSGK